MGRRVVGWRPPPPPSGARRRALAAALAGLPLATVVVVVVVVEAVGIEAAGPAAADFGSEGRKRLRRCVSVPAFPA